MGRHELRVPIRRVEGTEDLPLPTYQTKLAAAMDLYAAVSEPTELLPGQVAAIPTGIAVALPEGYEAQVRARSSLALASVLVANSPGTIDADYRGEISVILINLGRISFNISRGQRIAQILVTPIPTVRWEPAENLPGTLRGDGAFGHTGQ